MSKHLTEPEIVALVGDFRKGATVDELSFRYQRAPDAVRRLLNRRGVSLSKPRLRGSQLVIADGDTLTECDGMYVPTHFIVGYRRDGSSVILWQGCRKRSRRAHERLQMCEGYDRIVVEKATHVTASDLRKRSGANGCAK